MTKLSRFNRSLILGICVLILLVGPVHAASEDTRNVMDSLSGEVQQIFNKASAAVVKIRAVNLDETLVGTGFFIDDQGTLLTAYDVVQESTRATIEYNGRQVSAKIIGRDGRSGIALLKANLTNTPFIPIGDSDSLKMASGLVGIGYAYNLPVSPSFGIVTGFDVRYLNSFFATTHIRCNVPVNPGQIGGPLLNSKGEVVGMMVFSVDGGRECYGIPIKSANRIVADFKQYGVAKHGWVGVGVIEEQPDKPYAHAVYVNQLYANTPAAECGLHPGDQVVSIGDRKINSPQDILDAAFFARVGTTIPVKVLRDDRELTFNLKIIERPPVKVPVTIQLPYRLPENDAAERSQPLQVKAQE